MDKFSEELRTMRKYVGKNGEFQSLEINDSILDDISRYSKLKVILEVHIAKLVAQGVD